MSGLSEREAFEQWAAKQWPGMSLAHRVDGSYWDTGPDAPWEAWQAALARRPAAAGVTDAQIMAATEAALVAVAAQLNDQGLEDISPDDVNETSMQFKREFIRALLALQPSASEQQPDRLPASEHPLLKPFDDPETNALWVEVLDGSPQQPVAQAEGEGDAWLDKAEELFDAAMLAARLDGHPMSGIAESHRVSSARDALLAHLAARVSATPQADLPPMTCRHSNRSDCALFDVTADSKGAPK